MISSFRMVIYVFRGHTDSKWQNRDEQQLAKEPKENIAKSQGKTNKLGMRNAMEFRKGK